MKKLRGVVLLLVPLVLLVCSLIYCRSCLVKTVYFERLGNYGMPICNIDRHTFEGETCDTCGETIQRAGVFFSRDRSILELNKDEYEVRFSDYYDSYETFRKDYDSCLFYSEIAMVSIALVLLFYVVFFVARRVRSHVRATKPAKKS